MLVCAPHSSKLMQWRGSLDSLVIIREFSSEDVYHTWFWKLNALRCPILHADEFVDAVRCGLGCAGLAGPTCAPFSTRAFWILMCPCLLLRDQGGNARAQCRCSNRTEGCVRVRPSAETEVFSLIPGTEFRVADAHLGARQRSHISRRFYLFSPRRGGWPRLRPDSG